MIDIDRLLSNVDSRTVAQHIGMDVRHKGKYNFILCPGHEKRLGKTDTNASNCVLTARGYHCFGCNKTVNMVDMVSEFTGLSFQQALNLIAEIAGGEEFYQSEKAKGPTIKLPLTSEELEIIGIKPISQSFFVNKAEEAIYGDTEYSCRLIGEDILVCDKSLSGITLLSLYQNNRDLYNKYIYAKAKAAEKKYSSLIDVYCSREGDGVTKVFNMLNEDGAVSAETFSGLKNAIMRRMLVAAKIKQEHQKTTG